MVSGLTGASRHHSHLIRDLNRSARAEGLTSDPSEEESDSTIEFSAKEEALNDRAEAASHGYDEAIKELESRDHDVIAHEAAHMSAGGAFVNGAATYTYQVGPDGKSYAIGGEVGVDVSAVPGNPRATIDKMRAIQAAAKSPDDPSGQDMAVASAAAQIESTARAQLAEESKVTNENLSKQSGLSAYRSSAPQQGQFINATA